MKYNWEFYWAESRRLAELAADIGVPPSEIEDVVADVWLEAVEYRHRFVAGNVQRQLHNWLSQVLHSKAVDARRYRDRRFCELLGPGEECLIDDAAAKRAEVAEWAEWLSVRMETVRMGNAVSVQLVCARFYQERSIQEVAQEVGMTAKAVDSRIRRVLRTLRELAEGVPHNSDALP